MRTILAAGAVVVDDMGRVLLVRRGRDPGRGLWSVPGGRVEPGESFSHAVVREVEEETGLAVAVGDELWSTRVPVGDDAEFEIHDFAATVVAGDLRPGDDADAAAWVAPPDLGLYALVDGLRDLLRSAGVLDHRLFDGRP